MSDEMKTFAEQSMLSICAHRPPSPNNCKHFESWLPEQWDLWVLWGRHEDEQHGKPGTVLLRYDSHRLTVFASSWINPHVVELMSIASLWTMHFVYGSLMGDVHILDETRIAWLDILTRTIDFTNTWASCCRNTYFFCEESSQNNLPSNHSSIPNST